MRKKVFGKKLGRNRKSRSALLKSLTSEFVTHGGIVTTLAKAKAVQPMIESMAKLAASDTSVAAKRTVLAKLGNSREVADALFALNYPSGKTSGFTRILPMVARKGDRAERARIEWSFETTTQKAEDTSKKAESKQVSSAA